MEKKHAGFWIRLGALFIDSLLLSLILLPILRTVFPADPNSYDGLGETASTIYALIALAYFIVMTVLYGGTLGKIVARIKVVDENGNRITWGTAILREVVGKFISGIVFSLGFIWAGFDAKKQAWHDKIAKTYVVYK